MAQQLNYRTPRAASRPAASTYEDDVARREWLTPTILLAVAGAVYVIAGFYFAGTKGAAATSIAFFVHVLIDTVLAVITAYAVAFFFKIGFGTFWIAILKLSAIVVFSGAMASFLPGIFALMVYFGLMVAMLMTMLDQDKTEACIFAFVLTIIKIAVAIGLASMLR